MSQRLITPSKVTAWLECPHYLTLQSRVDAGLMKRTKNEFGEFADLVTSKGKEHERDCLARYRQRNLDILEVEPRGDRTFRQWVDDIGNPFTKDYDVIYQMPLIHDGMQGVADFVVKIVDQDSGAVRYEPVDAKLARKEAKPGHVLQLCFYADAIGHLTGVEPLDLHLLLGSGSTETLRANQFRPYWRRLRRQLVEALERGPEAETTPDPCDHCNYCEFQQICTKQWNDERSLVLVARIRSPERATLLGEGVRTLDSLAVAREPIGGFKRDRIAWLTRQASLQCQAEKQAEMPFEVISAGDANGELFEDEEKYRLPPPDGADLYLDFEGHPFWKVDDGLFFLFGRLERQLDCTWEYRDSWAHDKESEREAAAELIDYLYKRRQDHPGMHVYHYNSTERSNLIRLAEGQGTAEAQILELVDTGAFVDLYQTTLKSVQIGAPSYSLKCAEKLTGFERRHEIDKGAGAVLRYEHYLTHQDPSDLQAIATYNEDDVRATQALHRWLEEHRPYEDWRADYLEPEDEWADIDERVVMLHASDDPTQHFLGDVLGYWKRERRANIAPRLAKLSDPDADLMADAEAITGLRRMDIVERIGKNVKTATAMRFEFPRQELDKLEGHTGSVFCVNSDGTITYFSYEGLDADGCQVDLIWGEKEQEQGLFPVDVVLEDWRSPGSKLEALLSFSNDVLAGRHPHPVTMELLTHSAPRFVDGGPRGGLFADDLDEMKEWVTELNNSYVAVQGPPGTGKTFSAARLIHKLYQADMRVGITAFSHDAIDNLLDEILKVFMEEGDLEDLCVARVGGSAGKRKSVKRPSKNSDCVDEKFNIVAGTTWLFASDAMREAPLDVLIIEEAGQLSLADALAASLAARNVLLFGDPLQLAQVSQACHPNGSGLSVLEHVLEGKETIPPTRGVFLRESYRMHSDICSFISDQIYSGRLISNDSCELQTTVLGTGLRWIPLNHSGNSNASEEEANFVVREIERLIGTDWTDRFGHTRPLTSDDFMVVAPYNRQRRLIKKRLRERAGLERIGVGTVDKFQGKEAPVVFFSMTTSSGDLMVRGVDFLFSRNRLNVAISRARCLAYLICTEELLNTRARSVDDMRLIATLNAFVEWAETRPAQFESGL